MSHQAEEAGNEGDEEDDQRLTGPKRGDEPFDEGGQEDDQAGIESGCKDSAVGFQERGTDGFGFLERFVQKAEDDDGQAKAEAPSVIKADIGYEANQQCDQ